jgi:hypothetical protein
MERKLVNTIKRNIEKIQTTEQKESKQITLNDLDSNQNKEKLIISNKYSEDSCNGSFGHRNKLEKIKDNFKSSFSRNGKQFKTNLEKDVTVLSILDNPNTMKDYTSDSNILSTNRDYKNQEKLKKNCENKKEIDFNNLKKLEMIEIKEEQEKTQSTKTQSTVIEKGNTVSEADMKRMKFFEKMNGMMKSSTLIGKTDNVSNAEVNNKLSHTVKIVEKRNSINIKELIQNLENHMLGSY